MRLLLTSLAHYGDIFDIVYYVLNKIIYNFYYTFVNQNKMFYSGHFK